MNGPSEELTKAWDRILELDMVVTKLKETNRKQLMEITDFRLLVQHQLNVLQKLVNGP